MRARSAMPGCAKAEERKIAEEEALIRKSRESAERSERDAAEARKADEEKRRKHELETKVKAEQEAKKRFGEDDHGSRKARRHARGRRSSPTRKRLRAFAAVRAERHGPLPRRSRRVPARRKVAGGSPWSPRSAPTKSASDRSRPSAAAYSG